MSPRRDDSRYFNSDTYLHTKRYLELNGRCRLSTQWPKRLLMLNEHGRVIELNREMFDEHPDTNMFASHPDDIVGYGLLTAAENAEKIALAEEWFDTEIRRFEEMGWQAQADQIQAYREGKP